MSEQVENNTQRIPMDSIIESIHDSFIIDPDKFAAKFDPVVTKVGELFDKLYSEKHSIVVSEIAKDAEKLRESGTGDKDVANFVDHANKILEVQGVHSESFKEFKSELEAIIKAMKGGATVEERTEMAAELQEKKSTLADSYNAGNTDLDLSEFETLNEVIDDLNTTIKPKLFASKLAEAGEGVAEGISNTLEQQFSRGASELESSIVSLGDEFAPLAIVLQSAMDVGKQIIGAMWNFFKQGISKQFANRKDNKLAENQKKISNQKREEVVASEKQPKQTVQERTDTGRTKPEKVELSRKSVRDLTEEEKGQGRLTEISENIILLKILKQLKKNGKKENGVPLYMRIMPLLMVIPTMLGGILTGVLTLGATVIGAITAALAAISLPVLAVVAAVVGLGALIYTYGGEIIEWLSKTWDSIKSLASEIGTAIKEAFNEFMEWAKEKLGGAGEAVSNAAESATRAIPVVGDTIVDDALPAARLATTDAIESVADGAKNIFNITKNFFGSNEKADEVEKMLNGNSTKKITEKTNVVELKPKISNAETTKRETIAEVISLDARRDELDKSDTIELLKAEEQKQSISNNQQVHNQDTTVISNDNSSSTFVNKVDPNYPEQYYNQKSRDAFAN